MIEKDCLKKRHNITKILSSSFLACSLLSNSAGVVLAASTDVSGHWAQATINKWIEQGYVKGYEDGTFKPDNGVTRAEFMTLVNKAFGFSKEEPIDYKDVNKGQWFYSEIAKAKAAGYIAGYSDGTIKPNKQISRQEAAVILSKMIGKSGNNSSEASFKDSGDIAEWSKDSISAVVEKSIMSGYPDHTFKPKQNISRAESVVILDRATNRQNANPENTLPSALDSQIYDKAGTYGDEKNVKAISGSVVISSSDVKLQNTIINGDLTISETVKSGTVNLKNVTVKGVTTIKGGGPNSIYISDSTFGKVVINKKQGDIHIVASGKTSADNVLLQSGAKIEQNNLADNAKGLANLEVVSSDSVPVTLVGNFNTITMTAKTSLELSSGTINSIEVVKGASGSLINVLSSAAVKTITVNDAVKVSGSGKIDTAKVNVNGAVFESKPSNLQLASGVTITGAISSGGGGGGGGGGGNNGDSNTTLTLNQSDVTISTISSYRNVLITGENLTLKGVSVPGDVTVQSNAKLTNVIVNGTLNLDAKKNIVLTDVTVKGQTILK